MRLRLRGAGCGGPHPEVVGLHGAPPAQQVAGGGAPTLRQRRMGNVTPLHGICETLRDLRLDARMSQRELARRVGTVQSAISEMERGLTSPTLTTLDKIAAELGMVLILVPAVDS